MEKTINEQKQIRIINVRYYQGIGKIVCIITYDLYFDFQKVLIETGLIKRFDAQRLKRVNKNKWQFSSVAIAKCSPVDKFDEAVGKSIAFRKAKVKIQSKLVKINHALSGYYLKLSSFYGGREIDAMDSCIEYEKWFSLYRSHPKI